MEEAFEASGVRDTMFLLDNRVASFTKLWPHNRRRKCNPKNLSKTGFYHVGTDDSPDAAMCFMCDKQLDAWEPSDDVVSEHRKHAPACPWLNLDLAENRLKTFKYWPQDQFKASIEDFVAAGFYHAPSEDALESVVCFHCKKSLAGWEPDDDPFEEHLSHSKRCTFIKKAIANREAAKEEAAQEDPADADAAEDDDEEEDQMDNTILEQSDVQSTANPVNEDADAEPASSPKLAVLSSIENQSEDTGTVQKKQTKRSAVAKGKGKRKTNSKAKPAVKQAKPDSSMQLEDDDVQDMSLAEFLTAKRDEKIHAIVSATELKIQEFQAKAAATRNQLRVFLDEQSS
eukprot:TRINITY_DN3844_c0_g1_i1.p1 TRINITY_DN3844_c0_g1~~TRINITY_DN3844_c0_g1_i1.p1  ORF type:complete len:343 (+),score=97.66 TRINITY_DN3844_c0_g1_i1:117-1145(+)